jgi:DNA-binding CsgD family transcriptional regulator
MRSRIAAVAPHARRALLVNKAVGTRQAEAAAFADTLNGLSAAIFLLDAFGRIVHANTAASAMLAEGDVLRSAGGKLVSSGTQAERSLRELLASLGGPGPRASCIAFPITARNGERYLAHVLPLTAAARGAAGRAFRSVAALFVRKVAMDNPCGEAMARSFDLTPTELRVMLSIIDVGGVPETAAALGTAESTVKTHLHRVFVKTGTSRQADLVKIAAGFSSPLTG